MDDTKRSALLIGATGLIGRHCLGLLCESELYGSVTTLVRRPTGYSHAKLTEHRIDFSQPDRFSTHAGAHDIFCCLGSTIKKAGSQAAFYRIDHDYPVSIAKTAIQNGARRYFIVTAMGADPASSFFYSRVKGDVEKDLRALPFESLHIFRPSLLLGSRTEFRLGERLAVMTAPLFSWIMAGPLKHYRPITAKRVAEAMMVAAQTATKGVHVHLSGDMQ